jgi:superfamily II DNA or RNA helicase
MKLDIKRYNRQLDVLRKWIAMDRMGTFLAVTGFGKTFVGILSIKHIRKFFGEEPVIVVVPTLYLKQQWEEKLLENELSNVQVYTVQSRPEGQCKLLILDEIHRYTGDEFHKVFDSIDYQFILGLSATIDQSDEKMNIIHSHAPIIDTITTQEALDNEWISEFTIYCLPVHINEKERREMDRLNMQFNKFFSDFDYDFKTLNLCLSNESYRNQYASNFGKDPKQVHISAIQAMKLMRVRKNILYNHPNKVDSIKELVTKFPNKKIVIFSEDTDFADLIASNLPNAIVYHSNLPTLLIDKKTGEKVGKIVSDKSNNKLIYYHGNIVTKVPPTCKRVSKKKAAELVIEEFKQNKSNIIVTARAFDEGVDIPDIDMTIVAAGSSKARQDIQRRGRGLRKTDNAKLAINIQLYIPDSQEFKWTRSRLYSIPNVKWVADIDEIE